MSTTGTEKHCRLCLMLNKGGTKACRSLLLKRVEDLTPSDHQPYPWTIHEFLKSKKKEMLKSKMSKEKIQVLFPGTGVTDLAKWDLSLFCTILTTYCGLKQLARLDVERLRTLRNELCHMNEPHIDDVKYKDYFETIKVVATRILDNDNETKDSIAKVLNDIHEGPLSLVETLKEMHTFYSMEMDIREKLEYVKDVDERVLQKVEKFDELFERFDSRLEQIDSKLDNETSSKLHSARNNFLLPGVEIFFDLKNLSTEEEQRMSTVLEQLFEEVINEEDGFKSSLPADSYHKLREAVRRTFKLFLMRGWRITNARHECVLLHIRCLTFKSLAALFREHIQGQINMELTDLSEAISEMVCGKDALLETAVYKDEYWGVMDSTISAVEEFLTDQDCDNNPLLKEELQPHNDEEKHIVALTARHVTKRGPHTFLKECGYELDTCLSLLKTELETECNAPQVDIKASYKLKKTDTAIHQDISNVDNSTISREKEIEKNVLLEKVCGAEQDSCLIPLRDESGKECVAQVHSVQGSYISKSCLASASTFKIAGKELSLFEPLSESKVDSDCQNTLQTIALLEIYKSQRSIAHYLELAYLSFSDYPDIEIEVLRTSMSARKKHKDTADFQVYFRNKTLFNFMDAFHFLDYSKVSSSIEHAYKLKDLTEELKENYIGLQDTIRNLTKHCENLTSLRKQKEAKSHDKTMNIEEKPTEKEQTKESVQTFDDLQSKIDLERSAKEKETDMMCGDVSRKMKGMMSGSPGKEATGKPEITPKENWRSKYNYWRDKETIITKLRPGYALTGGTCSKSAFGVANLFKSVHRGRELKTGTMLHEETVSIEGEIDVQMMQTQGTEAMERLETIRKQEDIDGGIGCLREVEKHLKYIDFHFGRINKCWSELVSALTLLKNEGGLGTIYRPDMWERRSILIEEWEYVSELFLAFTEESVSDAGDLYKFC